MFKINQQQTQKNQLGDRYIPLRRYFNIEKANYCLNATEDEESRSFSDDDVFQNIAKQRYFCDNYKKALRSVFLPIDSKILNFHPPKLVNNSNKQIDYLFPVKPRNKPLIESPNIVLDLPEFNSDFKCNTIDCSNNGYIATIYSKEIHMLHLKNNINISTKTNQRIMNCLKWNKSGTLLAVSLYNHKLGILNVQTNKIIYETNCCSKHLCEITSIEWIADRLIIAGCSSGDLQKFDCTLQKMCCVEKAHKSAIINISTSCKNNYVATSGVDNDVNIWKLPNLDMHLKMSYPHLVRAFAWHPWKESIFAAGGGSKKGSISFLNINTKKLIKSLSEPYSSVKFNYIDCLTFNPSSAELVASIYVTVKHQRGFPLAINVIMVLINVDEAIEVLVYHEGRVLYLLWAEEGNLLVSASSEENLCIWNFFGPDNKRSKLKKNQTLKSYQYSKLDLSYCPIK